MPETLGQRFVRFLVAKDGDALKGLMATPVDFRAVTPGRCWESTDADEVIERILFGTWFSPERRITALEVLEVELAADLERVRYRMRVDRPDGQFVVEQQAYLEGEAEHISAIRLVCSGYLRV